MLKGAPVRAKDELREMVLRLLLGLVKGIVVGGLVGFGLAKIGFAAPGAIVAYLSAALVGALVGLIAGKPIWAADGRIEAGLKAGFGAILAVGLMWLTRKFITFGVPFDMGSLAAANRSLLETAKTGTFGGLSITSLALVAGVLGAFYDADNTPDPDAGTKKAEGKAPPPTTKARVATDADLGLSDAELGLEEESDKKQAKR